MIVEEGKIVKAKIEVLLIVEGNSLRLEVILLKMVDRTFFFFFKVFLLGF